MLSCKQLVNEINDIDNLSFFKRAELRAHLLMCKHCSAYVKHLQYMRDGFKQLFSSITQTDPEQIKKIEEQVLKKFQDNGDKS